MEVSNRKAAVKKSSPENYQGLIFYFALFLKI